jgi:hypothetical protein
VASERETTDAVVQNVGAVGYTCSAAVESDEDEELFETAHQHQGPEGGIDRIVFSAADTSVDSSVRCGTPVPPFMAETAPLFDEVVQSLDAVGYTCSADTISDDDDDLFERPFVPVATPVAIVNCVDWQGPDHLRVPTIAIESARPGNPLSRTLLDASVGTSSGTPHPTPLRAVAIGAGSAPSPTVFASTPFEVGGRMPLRALAVVPSPSATVSVLTPSEELIRLPLSKVRQTMPEHECRQCQPFLPCRIMRPEDPVVASCCTPLPWRD